MLRDELGLYVGWLGVFAGASSAASAFTFLFDVGLAPFAQRLLDYYAALIAPLTAALNVIPWPFAFTPLTTSLLILYVVALMMSIRSETLRRKHADALTAAGIAFTPSSFWQPPWFPISVLRVVCLLPAITLEPIWRLYRFERELAQLQHQNDLTLYSRKVGVASGSQEHAEAAKSRYAMSAASKARLKTLNQRAAIQFLAVPASVLLFFLLNGFTPQ